MEKYSKAVSEMYSQFKTREAHPLEKYIGRLAIGYGEKLEVAGYRKDTDETWALIVDGAKIKDWLAGVGLVSVAVGVVAWVSGFLG